jgi:ribosomal protein L37AE/L43A
LDKDKEKSIINMYRKGFELEEIIHNNNVTYKQVTLLLLSLKKENKVNRRFNDYFRKIIAERDMNGVDRYKISKELGISNSTVKKSCEKFGRAIGKRINDDKKFIKISDDKPDFDKCPLCRDSKVNILGDNCHYCLKCGEEFVVKKDGLYKINWEYID